MRGQRGEEDLFVYVKPGSSASAFSQQKGSQELCGAAPCQGPSADLKSLMNTQSCHGSGVTAFSKRRAATTAVSCIIHITKPSCCKHAEVISEGHTKRSPPFVPGISQSRREINSMMGLRVVSSFSLSCADWSSCSQTG